jgi:hypothetical protein
MSEQAKLAAELKRLSDQAQRASLELLRPRSPLEAFVAVNLSTIVAALESSAWVPASERLPDERVDVLCALHAYAKPDGPIIYSVAYRVDDLWFADEDNERRGEELHIPVKWQRLPAMPKEGENP